MQFGRVIDATLMMDKDTGRPRGFGFVTFDGDSAVDATLSGPLEILGKPIEVKRAQPRGNLREGEDDKKFGRRNGNDGKFGGRNDNQSGNFDGQQNNAQQGAGGMNAGMSPAMMAQYWQRMQHYFQMMQRNMLSQGGMAGPGMPSPMAAMGGGQMNPAMMQQMMVMNQMGAGGGMSPTGSPHPQSPGSQGGMGQMNPAMVQQMQQMQMQQQASQQGGNFNGNPAMMNQMGPAAAAALRPGFNAQEQLAFEQQKYEAQQVRRMQQGGGFGGQGGPTSWEGMYDDVPQPPMPPQGPAARVANQGGFGRQASPANTRQSRQGSSAPPAQPSNAPANAPTGPKNAGKPGSNYRGGGRHGGGGRQNFHPYSRGN
jgi:RNA-binding protein Musashi